MSKDSTEDVTEKFESMLSSFQCDLSLARDGYKKLSELDFNSANLLSDISLLEELEWGLRNDKLKIVRSVYE